jgi:hypothetical protein
LTIPKFVFYESEFWSFLNMYVFKDLINYLYFEKKQKDTDTEDEDKKLSKLDKYKIENIDIQDSWETLYEPNEDLAKYYFVLLSLFDKSLDRRRRQFPSKNFLYKKALDGFNKSNHKEIATHLNSWIILIKRMQEEYWN